MRTGGACAASGGDAHCGADDSDGDRSPESLPDWILAWHLERLSADDEGERGQPARYSAQSCLQLIAERVPGDTRIRVRVGVSLAAREICRPCD